ncbi:hypothetical protein AGMMS49992_23450 [Clostridia bacterium]|nr:hypothetical protein AGMMS49992_23450 [Clostridia bacterium]
MSSLFDCNDVVDDEYASRSVGQSVSRSVGQSVSRSNYKHSKASTDAYSVSSVAKNT